MSATGNAVRQTVTNPDSHAKKGDFEMTIKEKMKAISASREAVAVADELLKDPNRTLDFYEIVEIVYFQFFGKE